MPRELHLPRPGPVSDDFLRFGILFSDGSNWTKLGWRYPYRMRSPSGHWSSEEVAAGEAIPQGWATGFGHYPPDGDLTFVATWPAFGLSEGVAVVDATVMRRRAREAEAIWEK